MFNINFWLEQPAVNLSLYDIMLFYFFVGFVILAIVLAFSYFYKHPFVKGLLTRFRNVCLFLGVTGLLWFGFRYENTPIFARRFWALIIVIIALIWLGFIFKYLFLEYFEAKREYDWKEQNSRYMPGSNKRR